MPLLAGQTLLIPPRREPMKETARKLFAPILNRFEGAGSDYVYRPSHRKILVAVGALFLVLALLGGIATIVASEPAGTLPALVFLVVGGVCEVVGLLGSDNAVANIWKSD